MQHTPDHIAKTIADHSAERAEKDHLEKAVWTEKITVGHYAGDEERNIAFNSTEKENGVDPVLFD